MEEEPPTLLTHWLHNHPLNLQKHKVDIGLECKLCKKEISLSSPSGSSSGQNQKYYYRCQEDRCGVFLHQYCAALPRQLKHHFHPHTLHFQRLTDKIYCDACPQDPSGLSCKCSSCKFAMDGKCAFPPPSIDQTRDNQILHHSHPHLLHQTGDDHILQPNDICDICRMTFSLAPAGWSCQQCHFCVHDYCLGKVRDHGRKVRDHFEAISACFPKFCHYWCSRCDKLMHGMGFGTITLSKGLSYLCPNCVIVSEMLPADAPLPTELKHFLHPCKLTLRFRPFSTCNACNRKHHDISYHCHFYCDFFLHLGCHRAPTVIAEDQILHFCHCHPLNLDEHHQSHGAVSCHICEKPSSESLYSCRECSFYIHRACMQILFPQSYSPTHTLLPLPSFKCSTCNRSYLSKLAFQRKETTTIFCVKCFLWPGGRFKSLHHKHPLTDGLQDEAEKIRCIMCGEYCSGSTYHCQECSIYIHKPCAELREQLKLPYYPVVLRQQTSSSKHACCFLCMKNVSRDAFTYDGIYGISLSNGEEFYVDSYCAHRQAFLQYQGKDHLHRLTIVENLHGDAKCGFCRKTCKGSVAFRCLKCKLSLHLFCGPLPSIIKHPRHVHTLALQEYYVEDNESDEFACHVCEEHRDPRLRVYRCSQGCLMICDVECVVSAVLPLLRGEHGNVEVRTPYPLVASKVILKRFVLGEIETGSSGSNTEAFSLNKLMDSISSSTKEEELGNEPTENRSSYETGYTYTREEFLRFVEQFRTPSNLEKDFLQKHEGSVMTGDYQLPITLCQVYENFFNNYKITGGECKLSYGKRRYLVFIFCCVLHEMRMTKVVDATKEEILKWLGWIRYVEEEGGFNLGFLVDSLRQYWKAHFLIELKRIVDEKSFNLEQGIGENKKLIEELETKLEATKARLKELELEKKAHNAYRRIGAYGVKWEYKDALEIKWRNCYEPVIRNAPFTVHRLEEESKLWT